MKALEHHFRVEEVIAEEEGGERVDSVGVVLFYREGSAAKRPCADLLLARESR